MCLNVLNGEHKRIAGQDIQVYKVLRKDGTAPYQTGFKYKTHELYEQNNGIRAWSGQVHEGYHTFSQIGAARQRRADTGTSVATIVAVAVIPKGAEYYVGQNFEMVSDQLVLISLDNVA